jgi:hypothetical protein
VPLTAAIEAEPSKPNKSGSQEHNGDIVGLVDVLLTMTITLAEDESIGQASCATADVHRATTCEVKSPKFKEPAVRVPCPVADWAVADCCPTKSEDD